MIYTLTLNPALDCIITVPGYTEGAVNRASEEIILAGGKGINVSSVLTYLGIENTALGYAAGFTGDVILHMLSDSGVKNDFIRLDDGISRINVKIKADRETEINGSGPDISSNSAEKLYKKLNALSDGDTLVLSGSVPPSLYPFAYCDILERLKGKKLNIIVDTHKDLLTHTLKYRPFLIKPNIFELGEIFGKSIKCDKEAEDCARELLHRGAKNVLVSMGGGGALLLTEDNRVLRRSAPEGRAVNTTGAGDSMVAGFIAGYLKSKDLEEAFLLGLAAGSASAFSPGLATGEEILKLYNIIKERG